MTVADNTILAKALYVPMVGFGTYFIFDKDVLEPRALEILLQSPD